MGKGLSFPHYLYFFLLFTFIRSDALIENGTIEGPIPYDPSNPNERFDGSYSLISTLSSNLDADEFCNKYNHDNNYSGLKLGNRIRISDGTYNATWYIAGFDCEYNKVASDGKSYDNGYGIVLVPYSSLTTHYWDTDGIASNGYYGASVNEYLNNDIHFSLNSIFRDHLINRNVLLSNKANSSGSTGYTWTTAYCTLPSVCQFTGQVASHNNKYDDGEANYKLPLFNYMDYKRFYYMLFRNIYRNGIVYYTDNSGNISNIEASRGYNIYPLIYIR